jgi:hypothetical protein
MKPLIKFNHITKAKATIDRLLIGFDEVVYNNRSMKISTMTKKILNEMVKRDTKDKELKKLGYKLDTSFFDEVFENFLSLDDKQQKKFVELISMYKKRIFKTRIYQNILINYTHHNTKKMAYILTDKFKPAALQLPVLSFIHIVESPNEAYIYYQRSSHNGLFSFTRQIDPTCEAPLSLSVLKSLLEQSNRDDYSSKENEELYTFLVNHYNDEDGAKYGLHYLSIFDPKSYDQRIVSFIIQCKNNIQHKYRELANELDLLLYRLYEYSLVYDGYLEIADELAMTLTDKIISEAFGTDERSVFWKQYTSSIIEPIVFVKQPVSMFMMKFKTIGIIEYIDVGNATYLYEDDTYHRIKSRILASASNEKNILNINSRFRQHALKEVTKIGVNRYTHRGGWKSQFQSDMKKKYGVHPGRK